MKIEDLRAEYRYRYLERLGFLCGTRMPKGWEERWARHEALEAVLRLCPPELRKTLTDAIAAKGGKLHS